MALLGFLIVFPLVVAAILLVIRSSQVRNAIVIGSAFVIGAVSIWMAAANMGTQPVYFAFSSAIVDGVCTVLGIAIAVVVLAYSVKYKNLWAGALALIQMILALVLELKFAHGVHVDHGRILIRCHCSWRSSSA